MTTHDIRLLNVPVDLHWRSAATSEALMREFAVIASDPVHQAGIPGRLLALVDDLNGRYQAMGAKAEERLREAALRGESTVDLAYEAPADVVEATERLKTLFAEADAFCREGEQLLTLAPADDEVAYRNWFLDEFARQVRGEEPRPWAESAPPASPAPSGDSSSPERAVDGDATGEPGTVEPGGNEVVVAFNEAIDLESSATLRAAVTELREQGYERIVLDIGEVSFVDSVGLSVLVAVHRRLSEDGGHLVLRRPTRPVAKVLEVSGLSGLLDVQA